jgi:hypothetical protein
MNVGYLQTCLSMAFAIGLTSGCVSDRRGDVEEHVVTARFEDRLPVDGCSYIVNIDGVEYTPDAEGRAAIDERRLPNGATMLIEYHLTGKIGSAPCGCGSHADRPEIAFVFID